MSERNPYDFYATPSALCDAALAEINTPYPPKNILDAGAGAGAWGAAARRRWPTAHIVGVELRDVVNPHGAVYDEWHSGVNFLQWRSPQRAYDVIMMNPPFSLAQAFIEHAHTLRQFNGTIAALLRMSFLGSEGRVAFWQRHPPLRLCPIVPRPSFTDDGNSDSSEYAFYIWRSGNATRPFKWIRWDKPRVRGHRSSAASSYARQEVLL